MALPVNRLVRVSVNLTPQGAQRRTFGVLAVAGDSDVISGLERIRFYTTYEGVAEEFGVDAPESEAAQLYFAQSPKPARIAIARWLRTATAGFNLGSPLTATEALVSNFTAISSGGFSIAINGSTQNLTALDFTAVTNLNGVATVITSALTGGAVCTWTGSEFKITSGTTGEGVRASGTVTFGTNPTDGDTLVLNGVTITFQDANPTGNEVLIGATKEATAANLQLFLNQTSNVSLTVASYATAANVLTITYDTVGTGGNAYSLAETGSSMTISGATLTGGAAASSVGYATSPVSGTDISAILKLTSATSAGLVGGYDAETPAECALALTNKSANWYGLMFAASTMPTDDQSIAVSDVVEALTLKRMYGVTITNTNVLSPTVTNDLASRMVDAAYRQSLCQYSENEFAVASLFGRAFSVNFNANNTTITLMYKQEPSVVAEDLSETQANALQTKRCNVFVAYDNDTAIIQYGVMSGPFYIDEVHGLDWLQNAIETNCYNLLYTSSTKIPQTDSGVNQIITEVAAACNQGVNNGLIAPGVWNADGFGTLNRGDYLKDGFYIFAEAIALQSQSDREARLSPPIQVAVKLAGAIHEIDVLVNVNR